VEAERGGGAVTPADAQRLLECERVLARVERRLGRCESELLGLLSQSDDLHPDEAALAQLLCDSVALLQGHAASLLDDEALGVLWEAARQAAAPRPPGG
jgi:hypothetical protein